MYQLVPPSTQLPVGAVEAALPARDAERRDRHAARVPSARGRCAIVARDRDGVVHVASSLPEDHPRVAPVPECPSGTGAFIRMLVARSTPGEVVGRDWGETRASGGLGRSATRSRSRRRSAMSEVVHIFESEEDQP